MKTVPQQGKLKAWNRDRGFGFIQSEAGSKDVFLHISAVRKAVREPQTGDTILYTPSLQSDGRLRATNATIQGVPLQSAANQPPLHHRPKPSQPRQSPRPTQPKSIWVTGLAAVGIIIWGALALAPTMKSGVTSHAETRDSSSAIVATLDPSCNIKGNISWNSGRKYYHLPGMEDYNNTQIDPDKGERWFCTEDEAISSGWVKAPTP